MTPLPQLFRHGAVSLPLLDYERLTTAKPKWIIGYSDVSTVSTALTMKLGWCTVHSANLMELHPEETDQLTSNTLKWLTLREGEQFTQQPSRRYQSQADIPDATLNCTEPTLWKVAGENREVRFSGRLIGSCFDTITHLINTPYFDLNTFCQRFQTDGVILYVNNGAGALLQILR